MTDRSSEWFFATGSKELNHNEPPGFWRTFSNELFSPETAAYLVKGAAMTAVSVVITFGIKALLSDWSASKARDNLYSIGGGQKIS